MASVYNIIFEMKDTKFETKNHRAGKFSQVKTENFCGARQNILIFELKNPFFETMRRLGLQ